MRHRDKFDEMTFHLKKMEESFRGADRNYVHYFNSFLSSAQSVLFCLNKEFGKHPLYDNWKNKRSDRLPPTAKAFKNLRNVSEKEGPVKNAGFVIEFSLPEGVILPAHATFTSPFIDTHTGRPVSSKGTITTLEGVTTEIEALSLHDFIVVVESDRKTYKLNHVITDARSYSEAIRSEIEATEKRFIK